MYVLKRYAANAVIPDNDDFGNDSETFEWKYNNHDIPFDDQEFKFGYHHQQHQHDTFIHEFLLNNAQGHINYNVDQFLI